ncbi:MAG TPA: sulfotransferase domain-containing protein [Acidimicrobiales bacterium]|nr:sulfotransferase domain-containing protein [Acidimicrobiales bacterium]
MGGGPERTREYRNHHLDSTRWDDFVPRDDDIVITTGYKAGTTWTQRIVAALVLGPGPVEDLTATSPWIDARFQDPIEPVLARLESQRHRRFVKSHLAADGLPYLPQLKYLVVGRDTRDVFMSLWNHYSAYTELIYSLLNDPSRPGAEFPRCPATPRQLWPRWIAEGWFEWEPDGWPYWSHHHHLATWWAARDAPNIMFVHYNDLLADTEVEMRRIAAFLDIAVAEEAWPALLADVGIDAMREEARGENDLASMVFEGGAARFFYKGTNGRWRETLTDDDLALYEDAAIRLDPELRTWLEHGRITTR